MGDVTPLSLGLETLGGVFTKIIDRNTTIPVKKSQVFSTAEDNQPAVTIHVLQGERSMAADNVSTGRFDLTEIPPAPRGTPQIEVIFDIDANGIVHGHAKDKGTGKENKIVISGGKNLSEQDIERMVKEAKENEDSDKSKKEFIDIRNNADQTIYSTEKLMSEHKDKIKEEDLKEMESDLENLKKVKDGDSIEETKGVMERLQKSTHKASEAVYKANGPSNGAGGQESTGGEEAPSEEKKDGEED